MSMGVDSITNVQHSARNTPFLKKFKVVKQV